MSEKQIAKVIPFPEEWIGKRVGLLDDLLREREQVRLKHSCWFVTGVEAVESLLPFTQGWLANTHLNGGADLAWQEFLDWFRESQGSPLHQDWCHGVSRAHPEEQDKAFLVLLDLVAEYVNRFGRLPRGKAGAMDEQIAALYGPLPRQWGGHPVELLDALLWLRQRMQDGQRLSFLTGAETVDSLYCFFNGWLKNTVFNIRQDVTVGPFQDWLRDIKKEFPGEGWHVKYLRDFHGDHGKAVMKFLDLAAEFRASF